MLVEHLPLDFSDHDPGTQTTSREHTLADMGGGDTEQSGEPFAIRFADGGLLGGHGGATDSSDV